MHVLVQECAYLLRLWWVLTIGYLCTLKVHLEKLQMLCWCVEYVYHVCASTWWHVSPWNSLPPEPCSSSLDKLNFTVSLEILFKPTSSLYPTLQLVYDAQQNYCDTSKFFNAVKCFYASSGKEVAKLCPISVSLSCNGHCLAVSLLCKQVVYCCPML